MLHDFDVLNAAKEKQLLLRIRKEGQGVIPIELANDTLPLGTYEIDLYAVSKDHLSESRKKVDSTTIAIR